MLSLKNPQKASRQLALQKSLKEKIGRNGGHGSCEDGLPPALGPNKFHEERDEEKSDENKPDPFQQKSIR
jgi:hypothetical protein